MIKPGDRKGVLGKTPFSPSTLGGLTSWRRRGVVIKSGGHKEIVGSTPPFFVADRRRRRTRPSPNALATTRSECKEEVPF